MKWLVVNTESFSPRGVKDRKVVTFDDLPWVVRKFLSVFSYPFIILDECSTIKTSRPMRESKKSTRTRVIKQLNQIGERCILTGTLMSKTPLNAYDPYNFLNPDYFPEDMYAFAEEYCIMITIRVGRGRRILITQKVYEEIRNRLKKAFIEGGEQKLRVVRERVFQQYTISYPKQEWIIEHRNYSPFINQEELYKRLLPCSLFVRRKDVFDITFDKFVKEPIMRPVTLSKEAKAIAKDLVDVGFTDNLTLGKVPALDLLIRLQDVCNGFEPVEHLHGDKRVVEYKPLRKNPKLESLMALLEEIDIDRNQVVVWSSRKALLDACAESFATSEIPFVRYDGGVGQEDRMAAEKRFLSGEARVFLANQASAAYGMNCLAGCAYAVYLCVDGSVERYYQSLHRILRGELTEPKFAYHIYAEGTIEERQLTALAVGQELIGIENGKELFEVA
jgi:SNF2 family DNA or RNA helicase